MPRLHQIGQCVAGKRREKSVCGLPQGPSQDDQIEPPLEATVNRYQYDSHKQLRTHLADFVTAYNFARRLKILNGFSPYEYICKAWTKEPGRFILDPIPQMPGLNT